MSLAQEKVVTGQIEALFSAARAENYALGEQFILWFLKEQVEEVATMETPRNRCKARKRQPLRPGELRCTRAGRRPRSGVRCTRNRWFLILRSHD